MGNKNKLYLQSTIKILSINYNYHYMQILLLCSDIKLIFEHIECTRYVYVTIPFPHATWHARFQMSGIETIQSIQDRH